MVTSLALLAVLSCRMPVSPPVVVTRCEGADRVTYARGVEVRREVRACVVTRCEGSDRVSRTRGGVELAREAQACPVRFGLTTG